MPEHENNSGENCPTCNDHGQSEALLGGEVFARSYTPASEAELELTRRVFAAQKAGALSARLRSVGRPEAHSDSSDGLAFTTREPAQTTEPPSETPPQVEPGFRQGIPVPTHGSLPKSPAGVSPTASEPSFEQGDQLGYGNATQNMMDTDIHLPSQLTAPWFEPKPVQQFQEDGRFIRPEEPFSEIFYPDKSRGYQFPVPPRMTRQRDGTWLFLPCCRVVTGPRFTGIANSSGIRHVEGQRLPDGSRAQGRIEVAPTELDKGEFGVQFAFTATFLEQLPHYEAACCEVRLLFSVLNAHSDAVPYPHSGFSSEQDPRKAWVEDRHQDGRRYGHRSDSNESASDLYLPDRATGQKYSGNDTPQLSRMDAALAAASGEIWRYMLIVIDTCCGGVRAMSDVLDVVWAKTDFQ